LAERRPRRKAMFDFDPRDDADARDRDGIYDSRSAIRAELISGIVDAFRSHQTWLWGRECTTIIRGTPSGCG
jgi:hypothetical protein